MLERRRCYRVKSPRVRAWLATPHRCWVDVIDRSSGGLRVRAPRPVASGRPVTVYDWDGTRIGPGRRGIVVHVTGSTLGLRFAMDLTSERRSAPRHATPGLQARVGGSGPATVLDLSAGGALVQPPLSMRAGMRVTVELLRGKDVAIRRTAVILRVGGGTAALRFEDGRKAA